MIVNFDLNDTLFQNMETICFMSGGRLKPSDFTVWDTPFGHLMGMSDDEALAWAYKNPSLQLLAQPHQGVKEALDYLKHRDIYIKIVTATILSIDDIVERLETHNLPFDEIVKSKEKFNKEVLIDDSPKTIVDRKGLPTIIFNQKWNEGIPGDRLYSWYDFPAQIEKYLI